MPAFAWTVATAALEKQQQPTTSAEAIVESADQQQEIQNIAGELRRFLGSPEGHAAMRLLQVSGDYIVLAVQHDKPGNPFNSYYRWVWYLDGDGLHVLQEASQAMNRDVYGILPRTSPATAEDVARAKVHTNQSEERVLACIVRTLDTIAERVTRPAETPFRIGSGYRESVNLL